MVVLSLDKAGLYHQGLFDYFMSEVLDVMQLAEEESTVDE